MTLSPGLVTVIMAAHHSLGGAAGGHDFLVRVDGAAHIAGLLAGQGLSEVLGPPGDGVLMGPSRATWASRSRIAWGGSKSGKPWDRFTAPYFRETRVIRRITESVKLAVRSERGWGMVKITP